MHGVTHFSASQINEYIQCPARWILRVSGHRSPVGPGAWRGRAVDEAARLHLVDGADILAATQAAHDIFDQEAAAGSEGQDAAKIKKERDAVADYVELACLHYAALEGPVYCQVPVRLEPPGLPVPIVGFVDFHYPGASVRDLKTVARMPSSPPDSVCRQLAIYSAALEGVPAVADYVQVSQKTKQVMQMPVDDLPGRFAEAMAAAEGMVRLLSISEDIRDVAGLLRPDFDDWRWSHPADRAAAEKLWGSTGERR